MLDWPSRVYHDHEIPKRIDHLAIFSVFASFGACTDKQIGGKTVSVVVAVVAVGFEGLPLLLLIVVLVVADAVEFPPEIVS